MRRKKARSPLKYVKPEPEDKIFFTCKSWAWAQIAAGFLYGSMVVAVGSGSRVCVWLGAIIWASFVLVGIKNLLYPAPVAVVTKQGLKIKKHLFTWSSFGGKCFINQYGPLGSTPSGYLCETRLVLGKHYRFNLVRWSEEDQKILISLLKRRGITVVIREKIHIPFLRYFRGGEDLSMQQYIEWVRRCFKRK